MAIARVISAVSRGFPDFTVSLANQPRQCLRIRRAAERESMPLQLISKVLREK